MKKILIYGDSNVWGDNFCLGCRIPDEKQWPNILQEELKGEYKILQEGLPGRLAGNEESIKRYKNGKDSFLATFRTNAPVNQIIFMLGTNDLQEKYGKTEKKIIADLEWYTSILLEEIADEENKKKYFVDGKMPSILYILPIPFDYLEGAKGIFTEESENKRKKIIKYFTSNQKKYSCISFDSVFLFEDGIHLNYEGHVQVAKKVREFLKNGR